MRVYTLSSCGVINYYAGIPAIGPKELTKYRLDDGLRCLRDLDHRRNRKFRCPVRIARGHLTSFQGDLNLVDTDDSSSNIARN